MADIKLYGTLIRDDDTNTQKIVNAVQVAGGYFVCPSKPTSGVWANGQLCYCTEDKKFYQYNGTDWEEKKYVTEHQSLEGYAKESYVDNAIKNIEIPDVSGFITSIPDEYITETELNNKGYLTEHQSLENYYTKTEVDNLLPNSDDFISAEQLLDSNIKLSSELKTYYNVGKITNASGTNPVSIGKAGDTLRDVLNNLFSMDEIQPSITQNPSVSCSLSSTESDERGTDISQVSYSITFNDGAYTNASSTGVSMTGYSFSSGTASSTTETYGTLTLPTTYTVGTSSAFSTTITANYSDGNVAKTNLGNNSSPVIQITASSCTATPTFSKTAVDYPYYVSSTASSISGLSSVTKAKKSTSLTTSAGSLCNYNANAYIWIFIRKGTNTSQPTKTIQAYSDIAKEWGTFLGGTEKMGEITFNKENGKSDTFYAYRTTNVAQAADSATFRLQ